jgi:ATP phosphoribosyltransferase regulatory subunit HisZ
VPDDDDAALVDLIEQLREAGERVVVDLTRGKSNATDQQCNRIVLQSKGSWIVNEV